MVLTYLKCSASTGCNPVGAFFIYKNQHGGRFLYWLPASPALGQAIVSDLRLIAYTRLNDDVFDLLGVIRNF
jgi:hypothetical protein